MARQIFGQLVSSLFNRYVKCRCKNCTSVVLSSGSHLLKTKHPACIACLRILVPEPSETGVFKTRNGEMAKWRNDEMAKWLKSELANYFSKSRKKTGAIFRLTGVQVCRSTVCIYRPLLVKCSLKIPSNLLA